MATHGDSLRNDIGTGSAILEAEEAALVAVLALLPHLAAHLAARVLLVARVVGVAGQLTRVPARQPRVTRQLAPALGKALPDVRAGDHPLQIYSFINITRKKAA